MAGHVGVVHIFVDDLGPERQQAVDDLGDGLFIAGDRAGRDDDEVIGADAHLTVAGLRHAGQRAQRLALAAGGDEHDLLRRVFVDFVNRDKHIIRRVQVAQLAGHLGVGDHAAPTDGDLAARLNRQVDDLLHAVDVGGERCHDDAALAGLGKQAAHAFGDGLFSGGEARALCVGGICQQRQHTLAAILGNRGQVGHSVAGQRRVVDLEVTGVDDHARRAVDGEGQRVRDGVVDVDRLNGEAAERDLLARADLMEDCAGRKAVLLKLVLDKTNRQLGGVDRHIEFFEQVRQTADVVLMTVGDEQALDAVPVLEHVGEVRDDQIDAKHIGIREHKAAVNEDHVALALIQRNVLADLAEAAQRADVHRDGRGHLKMLRVLRTASAALALGARCGSLTVLGCSAVLILARAARTRSRDALRGGVLLGSGRGRGARAAGAGLVLRVGSVLTLGLGCARLAGMGRTLAVLGRLCGIFTFWLELFHRKPPNRRISGLVPAICRYRIPSKAVAIYVF